jgi:hypothetical protein
MMPAELGLMIVAAFTLAHWLDRLGSSYVRWFVSAAIVLSHLFLTMTLQPFKVQSYPEYSFYNQLRKESADFALLEIPFGVRSGLQRIGTGGEMLQYYQHIHGKRLLNGSMARLPSRVFDFYRTHAALMFLSGELTNPNWPQLSSDFEQVLRWSNAHYVLVHRELMSAEQFKVVSAFLDHQSDLKLIGEEPGLVIYKITN